MRKLLNNLEPSRGPYSMEPNMLEERKRMMNTHQTAPFAV